MLTLAARSLAGFTIALLTTNLAAQRAEDGGWWSPEVKSALGRAGDNRAELEKALKNVPEAQREEMAFLVAHMPERDLRRLKSEFLLTNVALARKAIANAAWGKKIPKAIYLNDVLPYANVSEARDQWRQEFHDRFYPLVAKCKTAGEAAQVLNSNLSVYTT